MKQIGLTDILFKRQRQEMQRIVNHSAKTAIRGLSPGRQTNEKWDDPYNWFEGAIPRDELRSKDIMEKLKIIRDLNPDASMAIWNVLRMANNGHHTEAVTASGKPHKRATNELNDLAKRVGSYYGGGTDQLINTLLMSGFTQGAIALEVELNEELTDVVDFHALDPFTLHFRRDKETGELQLIQYQSTGEYKILNQEQVFYYPIDPDIQDPYGRSPMLPALQTVMFQAGVLSDLKKVLHHQGHERFDISVVEESIINNMPDHIKNGGPEAISNYVSSYISDVQNQMDELEPDDDFFHTDSIEINTAGGSKQATMDAQRVIDIINQHIVTSLKQLPILLGRNEGTTETHGTIQWQIYAAGIESLQRSVKRVLEKAYNVALQVKGRPLKAKVTFNPIQKTDRLKDAQAEQQETRNKIDQVKQGWITNDEASMEVVGHEAVEEPQQQEQQASPLNTPRQREEPIKKRAIDERDENPLEIEEPWADDIYEMSLEAEKAFFRFLKDQRKEYIKRLEEAEDIPTMALIAIASLKMLNTTETPEPPPEFERWVNENLLYDSDEQQEDMEELVLQWIDEAILIAGQATLNAIATGVSFSQDDEELQQWLTSRTSTAAELIQGVSEEHVINSLWEVAFAGAYSTQKAADALREEYAFSQGRADKIAKTEIVTAGRAGQFYGGRQSGMVIGKRWRSALLETTRDGHREAHNQVVHIDEPFYVNNSNGQPEALMFPGDHTLGAGPDNLINCYCWYELIFEGQEDQLT